MSRDMKTTALVLGATGGIGGAVARKLLARGWRIRALNRDAAKASRSEPAFEWVQGDAMNAGDVLRAADGVGLIVHAVNPPGYRDWETLVLPMLDNTIAAARAVDARIVLPGNVYNFGPDALPAPAEESPQHPLTKKGAIRVEMEKRLEAASQAGAGAIIVRAGDFFGPGATGNSWFSSGLVTPGKPVGTIKNPGRRGVGHQWTYLPDMAETIAQLIDRADRLPSFAVYHMDGFWDADGMQMAEAIKRVAGGKAKIGRFPGWIIALAAPFIPMMREINEMRYLWKVPLRMRNDKLVAELGKEPQTPIDEAVRASLAALGCLPEPRRATAAAFIGHSPENAG
ncbi:nucleoside-diphosphate-sugar epimerase [Rhizobium leguminosarum]|uniref:Nucleoside-diphosphate-sugar epimerase n=1 Tax=Rhizobium leguminosarum TaxID=384 RepID=A0AAE2MLA6_RHILE|nr:MULTISPECIES: NAD(P)H-binding protein [Rhizobium]MBB4291215.1 nucleoside-diphosphate-sugar epimerase [Rhizobium leguminosarum]MBB4297689.1 nucleoside-diphosphate-sugar epimerase [Rhizobium leguminosarum]MBB4308829.1 nucleoside-diphosphate-sugar epimerase [Rhizobium leguminosarum]MBB4416664.1 nucleoside-diphosphate-sugar epimerase [Rhizobium leguminosarum]MBB4430368.1 nucleoside-diphosphate-sugar epimerase [Rhizobium esperanzae]